MIIYLIIGLLIAIITNVVIRVTSHITGQSKMGFGLSIVIWPITLLSLLGYLGRLNSFKQ